MRTLILFLLKKSQELCMKLCYKICRRVYQPQFIDQGDIFIEYIQSLDLDEIQKMDNDIKSNGWG